MSSLIWGLAGLVVGLAAGAACAWAVVSRRGPAPATPPAGPARPQATAEAEPGPWAEPALADETMKPVIEASRSLVEDLERRYAQPQADPEEPRSRRRPKVRPRPPS